MKVIAEEDAINFRNHLVKQDRNVEACAIDELIEWHSEEIDTLTVSKLRPMCEVEAFSSDIQVFYSGNCRQSEIYYWDESYKWYYDIESTPLRIDDDYMLGFIPAVKYKP